jgi:group II intron reverse transcriptase/maturase/CRISPR-associated endonuclease Cas1
MKAFSALAVARARDSLFVEHMADDAVLREAWYRVQRGGRAAGVDGMTVDAFRPRADHRLRQLRDGLLGNTYEPSPVRRVQIPKPSGGVRVLGLPTIADRIAQTAAALVLHDRVTSLFSDRSFAYRPFLGPRRAAAFLRSNLPLAAWVVTADIEKFFDNVEHRILAQQLRNVGIDEVGVGLILKWLLVPVDDRGRWYQPVKGLPQGSPVAPVLANLYLTGFDIALEAEGFTHVRYADDFVVLAPDEEEAQRGLRYVSTYLGSKLRLRIKPAKTQIAPADAGFTFVGFRFTQAMWMVPAESVDRFKNEVTSLLGDAAVRSLVDAAKSHNDVVRGWRNYYCGNSSEMDRQLQELDAWRSDQCRAYLERAGKDADAAPVWFERLIEHADDRGPAGTYTGAPHEDSAARDLPADPPDDWHGRTDRNERPVRGRVFSSVRQVRDAHIGRKQLPVMLDDGWLRVPTFGGFVTKSHGLIVVRRKKQVIFEVPFEDVSCLTVEADGVVLSTTVVHECARRRIPIAVCGISGKPVARVIPARSPLDAPVVHLQLRARVGKSGTPLIQAIVAAKLSNQRALLLYHSKYRRRDAVVRRRLMDAAVAIGECLQGLGRVSGWPMRKARPEIFLTEARAAAHYWEAFGALVPPHIGFRRRVHPGAEDVVNKALNYGYMHLLSRVWVAVHRAGLEPSLGLLHTGRRRSAGLVFDLMEPFRQPVVDKAVLGLLGRSAKLELTAGGDLTLRTRALLQRALSRRLTVPTDGSRTLEGRIQRHVIAFRQALAAGRPYEAYRMSW